MRVLGIDYGNSRIGVAVSDPMGWTAQSIETIEMKNGMAVAVERIKQLSGQYKVQGIVVGFPINMNGTLGPKAVETQQFIDILREATELEIIKWDERLTTVAAHKAMNEMGVKTSKKRGIVDRIAAVFILQGYLDSKHR